MKNFFNNLLNTGFGKVIRPYEKIKSLPPRKQKTKGNIFESKIV